MDRSYEFEKVDAIRPRVTFGLFVKNAIFLMLSFITSTVALMFSITIIGIILAIPTFGFSLAFYQMGSNRMADIECPNCGMDYEIAVGSKSFDTKCAYCKVPLIVTDITEEVPKEDRPKKITQRDRKKMRKRERKERRLARKSKRI